VAFFISINIGGHKMDDNNVANNDIANIPQDVETCVKNDFVMSDNGNNTPAKQKPGKKALIDSIDDNFLQQLTGYASQSITNIEISKLLNISVASFYNLMNISQDFRSAYDKGIDNRKFELEKALLKRAEGFMAQETKTETDADGNVTRKTVTDKHYVPDSTALIFGLKNLYADKYKDRVESVSTINVNVQQLQNLPDEELLKFIKVDEIDYNIE